MYELFVDNVKQALHLNPGDRWGSAAGGLILATAGNRGGDNREVRFAWKKEESAAADSDGVSLSVAFSYTHRLRERQGVG